MSKALDFDAVTARFELCHQAAVESLSSIELEPVSFRDPEGRICEVRLNGGLLYARRADLLRCLRIAPLGLLGFVMASATWREGRLLAPGEVDAVLPEDPAERRGLALRVVNRLREFLSLLNDPPAGRTGRN